MFPLFLSLQEGSSSGVSLLSLERTRSQLNKAAHRITELEETLHGKQAALDSLVQENDELKTASVTSESTPSPSGVEGLPATSDNKQVSIWVMT